MSSLRTLMALGALGLTFPPVLAANSPGCGTQPTLTNGIHRINNRECTLKLPDSYSPDTPHHLIFGLHWLGGNMDNVANGDSVQPWYGLESLAEGSAIFVAPNGLDAGWANTDGRDVALIDAIIEQVEADLCVDQTSRFATGFSYGGGMSYALACARSSKFRAVSVLSGGLISGCDGGNDPIAYLGIHGISDPVLSIDGGIQLADTFVENNNCQRAEIGQPAPGSGESVRTDFVGCDRAVSFIAYDGGHDGAPFGFESPMAPDATWEFFMAA